MHTATTLRQTKRNGRPNAQIRPDYTRPIDHESDVVCCASLVAIHRRVYRSRLYRKRRHAVVVAPAIGNEIKHRHRVRSTSKTGGAFAAR